MNTHLYNARIYTQSGKCTHTGTRPHTYAYIYTDIHMFKHTYTLVRQTITKNTNLQSAKLVMSNHLSYISNITEDIVSRAVIDPIN